MSASVTRSFIFQSRSPLTGTWRTYRVSVTSSPTGYAARVTELVAGGGEAPVMLPDGPRYGLSPSNFHALRRHYRGELVGEIRAELRRDAVQPINRLPRAAGLDAYDCYIRSEQEAEMWPQGYPGAQNDDLSDMTAWEPAAVVSQE